MNVVVLIVVSKRTTCALLYWYNFRIKDKTLIE